MNSLIAVSLWIALVTVVPGLITIAAVLGAATFVDPDLPATVDLHLNEWVLSAVAVAVMVLTQSVGILLEDVLVTRRWLGPERIELDDEVLREAGFETEPIDPYDEYQRLYLFLVRLGEGDDHYGHLERSVAQFFLTTNTLVSFGAGIVATVGLVAIAVAMGTITPDLLARSALAMGVLLAALWVSYRVAIARFQVMVLSSWSLRTRPDPGTGVDRTTATPSTDGKVEMG